MQGSLSPQGHRRGDNVANGPMFTLSLRHHCQHYRSILIILGIYLTQTTVVHRKKYRNKGNATEKTDTKLQKKKTITKNVNYEIV